MFEAGIYFFGGPGHIVIQQEDKRSHRTDFDYRTLFSISLNVRYEIFNDSDTPVRVVAVTGFPFVINSTNSEEFIFDNPRDLNLLFSRDICVFTKQTCRSSDSLFVRTYTQMSRTNDSLSHVTHLLYLQTL